MWVKSASVDRTNCYDIYCRLWEKIALVDRPSCHDPPQPRSLARDVPFLMSAEYSVVMWEPWPGTIVTWRWLRFSMTYCSDLRLWSQICVTYRSCWFPDLVALSCCAGACRMPRAWRMAAYIRDGYGAFRQPKFECGSCEIMVFMVCGVRHNFYMFSLYSNPALEN